VSEWCAVIPYPVNTICSFWLQSACLLYYHISWKFKN